jgi:hypothetical protein
MQAARVARACIQWWCIVTSDRVAVGCRLDESDEEDGPEAEERRQLCAARKALQRARRTAQAVRSARAVFFVVLLMSACI